MLLSVDDAHLLDDHSAALVLQLAMSMPSFVVATIRTGERVPDPVVALWKDGLAERVEVGRLDDAAITALAAQVLGGPVEPGLARAIVARADGNALVARELCLAGRDSGVVALDDGRWGLIGDLRVSPRLVELVRGRVDDLSDVERQAVDVVAHGEPLALRIARDLATPDALLALERRGTIVLREDGRRREVWLSHPIYAEVVRAMTGPMLAAAVKGRLAMATGATGMRRRSDLLRVATWQLEAGDGDAALLMRAATETYNAGDMIGTARLAAGSWDVQPTAHAGLLLGTALGYSGRYEESDAIFAAAAGLAGDDATRARVAMVHAAILSAGLGQPEAAIELLAEAEGAVEGDTERSILQAQRAHLLALSGDVVGTLALTEPLLARFTDGPILVTAAMASILAQQRAGTYVAIIALAERALPETRRLWGLGQVSIPSEMLELQAFGARISMGELDAPPPATSSGPIASSPALNRPVAILTALHLAAMELGRGRPRTAATIIDAVGAVQADLLGASAVAWLASCHALLGEADLATATLWRARSWRRPGTIFDPYAEVAEMWTLVAAGEPAAARQLAEASLASAIDAHRWGQALDVAHTLARIGGIGAAHAALARIEGQVDGTLADVRRLHIEALAADDADGLEAASEAFAGTGAMLEAAEAAADAARAARRAGDPRRGTRLAHRALELASLCEGARTPALVMPAEELTPLSRRELEIAELAAGGLSSEEIAGRLFLSVRTVDNHLQHVYQKLGIGSRAELRAALRSA